MDHLMGELLKFTKSAEKVLLFKRIAYFKLTELESDIPLTDISTQEIINSVITTPYHFWGGEKNPLGQTFNVTTKHLNVAITEETVRNTKFYGFYDTARLQPSDYRQINYEKLFQLLDKEINYFSDCDLEYLLEVHEFICKYMKEDLLIFHLVLDREIDVEKVSKWSVYTSFEGFLFINRHENKVTIVEAGED